MRFPSSNLPALPMIQPKIDHAPSEAMIAPSREAVSDQSIKHVGVMGPRISDLALQALPSKLNTKKHTCTLSPAHCPCRDEGICVTYKYISLENFQAHKHPFRKGRFRINPNFTFSVELYLHNLRICKPSVHLQQQQIISSPIILGTQWIMTTNINKTPAPNSFLVDPKTLSPYDASKKPMHKASTQSLLLIFSTTPGTPTASSRGRSYQLPCHQTRKRLR